MTLNLYQRGKKIIYSGSGEITLYLLDEKILMVTWTPAAGD